MIHFWVVGLGSVAITLQILMTCCMLKTSAQQTSTCAGIPVVPFLDLNGTTGLLRNVDDGAARVNLPSPPLLFGSATFTTAYVSSNGLISFGSEFTEYDPQTFPISAAKVIAPYWDDINLSQKGVVRYAVITHSYPTLSFWLNRTNEFIKKKNNVEFKASWLLVARWIDVCPFLDENCLEENNFQVVVATNGDQSYAVFTYKCGELNWLRGSSEAGIGFSAGPNLYANHRLSRQPNVNDIACVNQTCPPWTNVVYRVHSPNIIVTIVNKQSYVVDGDQNLILQCNVTLNNHTRSDLNIRWSHNNSTIYNCSNLEPSKSLQNSNALFTCNLTLANISSSIAGLYNCTGYIAMGEKRVDSFNLKVEGSLQNSVLVTPRNATVGQSSMLTCKVQTSLPVTTSLLSVQWRHRGGLITTNNGGFVRTQGTENGASVYVTELRFDEISVEHSGLYSCHVSLDTNRWQVTNGGNLTVTLAYSVHIGVSNGFPTQPLVGNSTRLNCSVTPNPQLNHTFLTIQYQWYTNSTLRGSVQELVLPNLSPADATTYSCVVTISSSNPTLLIRQISNQSTYELTLKMPILNVSLSSNASTVLDISGYNSFTLQCSGKVNPIITQSQESFSFKLTKNGLPVTKSPSISSTANLSLTLFQNSSIQQNASLGPDSLIYNCTVRFSVSGSIIATNSSTTKIIVKGPLLPAAPVVHQPPVTSPTSALIQWSVPEVTYSPEQYTVYYTTNSSSCPDSDEGYNKSVTVYGLNHTEFYTIRDQQYNVTLNNLHPYTVYCYKVVVNNSVGRNESSLQTLLTDESVPSEPPQSLVITMKSHNLTLSWSPPLPSQRNGVIISYLIICSSGDIIINTTRTSSTSLTITGLQPFTNYTCSVSASTIIGDGPTVVKHILTSEDRPYTSSRNFTVSLKASTFVQFIWSDPMKANGVITEYQLQCFSGVQEYSWTVNGSQTTTILSGLLPYTNYSCSITAHTSVGGGPAATTNVVTKQDVPSGHPQNLSVSKSSRNLTLSWSPPLPSQRNGVIISYLINCSSGDIISTTRISSTSLTITGLQPFTNYSCFVSASTIVGNGPATLSSIITREETPGPPSKIMGASNSSSTITLSWSPPAKPNGVITRYSMLCSHTAGVVMNISQNFNSSQTTATLSGLLPYTNYSCSITAHTSVGEGPAATINVPTIQDIPSGPPRNMFASSNSHNLTLSWSPPLPSQRNGLIISYLITCSSGNIIINTRTSSTSLNITGLQPFTNYTCSVSASTIIGDGPAAVVNATTDEDKPGTAPNDLNGTAENTTAITLSWKYPVEPNGVITHYQLQCTGTGKGETLHHSVNSPQTTTTLSGLLPYTNYSCSITAHTSVGGGPAATTNVLTKQDAPNGLPQNVTFLLTSRNLTLSWSPPLPLQRNGVIISYLIICSSGDIIINTTRTSSTSLTITGLQPFTNYTCSLSASTIVGDGPAAKSSAFTLEERPMSPPKMLLLSNITSRTSTLTWGPPLVPHGVIRHYLLQCTGRGQTLNHTVNGSQTTTTLSGLLPYTNYSCGITAHTNVGGGPAATINVATRQDVPSAPPEHINTSTTSITIMLSWSPPTLADQNGIIVNYQVTCRLKDDVIYQATVSNTRVIITKLEPFTNYSCSVSASTVVGSGPAAQMNIITEKVPPMVVLGHTNIVQVINSTVVIQFSIANAAPPVEVEDMHWTFTTQSGVTTTIINTTEWTLSLDRLTVEIPRAQLSYIGTYTISASNPAGVSTGSVHLDIHVPAKLLYTKGSSVTRSIGMNVTFNCSADGIPRPQVSWRRNGQLLTNIDQIQRYNVIMSTSNGFRSAQLPGVQQLNTMLTILNLKQHDQGSFSCIAQSANTDPAVLQTAYQLVVNKPTPPDHCKDSPCENGGTCGNLTDGFFCHCTSSFTGKTCNTPVRIEIKPRITTHPQNITGVLFSTVTLRCTAEGFPQPEYHWYKDGNRLATTSNILVIDELRPRDRGFYRCQAENSAGTAKSDIALINIEGVVQYEAVIEQKDLMQDTEMLLEQINNILAGSRLAINASFFFIQPLLTSNVTAEVVPIIITLITDDGGSEKLRQEVLVEMERVELLLSFQISINVTTVDRFDGCRSAITLIPSASGNENLTISIVWPETNLAELAEVSCPCGTLNITAQVATRYCGGDFTNGAKWLHEHSAPCDLSDNARRICQLSLLEPEQRLDKLQEFTNVSNQIETDDVSASATLLVATTRDVEGNKTLSENFLNVVDNIVRADPDVLQESQTMANSSAKLLDALERVSESIPIPENEMSALVTQTTFAVSVQKVDSETFNGLNFSAVLGNFSAQQIDKNALLFNMMSSNSPTGSLSLPSNLLDKANSTRVTLSVFITNALFLRRRKVNLNKIGSIVIAAGVVGTRRVENIYPPVETVFQRNPEVNGSNPVCSFWDQALDDGYGGWSSDGCSTVNSSNSTDNASSEHVTCMCNHLTNFAILLDVSPNFGSTMTPNQPVDLFLDAVSYIGVILSIFGLLLTFISYIMTKKLCHSDHGQLLLNLCLALLGLYVAFIFSVHSSGVVVLCTIVSVVLHYFMLVVFMVMAAEAVNLYMKLVVVLGRTISHYVFKATIICWVVPVFVVLFCFAPSPKSYMHPNVCRVHGIPFYVGLIAPFIIIYLFNWVVYVIILCSLFCKCSCKKEDDDRSTRVKTKHQLIAAVTLSVLFGLGWGIGLIATEGVRTKAVHDLFSALFIICTAFQGVMVFCLQTLRSKEVRNTWLSLFYRATGKNISTWRPSKYSNSRSQSQFDSSTLRQGFSLKSNDYESVTLPKNVDAFDVKVTTFHETVEEKSEENNDEKKGELCSSSSSPSLSQRKEASVTEEKMEAANHQEDIKEEQLLNCNEDEPVHVEPNTSTFSVEEVQIRFGDSPTPTFETQITEKVQSVAANEMKGGNITAEVDDGLSSADADK